jgi:hypothetical protein
LTEEAPRLPEMADVDTVRIDSGTTQFDEGVLVPAGPATETGPMTPVTPPIPPRIPTPIQREVPEAHVRPILPDVPPIADEPQTDDEMAGDATEIDFEMPEVPAARRPSSEPAPPIIVPPPIQPPPPPAPITEPAPGARSEIESLLEEDRARYETVPVEEIDEPDRMAPGPWLVAIAVTVVLAVLAGVLITRGSGLFGGAADLPSADEVRTRVARAVGDMKSLKASFEIQKVGLYRVRREDNTLQYSFSNGVYAGRMTYDRAEGYKQDLSLTVGSRELEQAEIVQTADETQSIVGTGDARDFLTERNPPLGPPDGNLRPKLGVFESSLATAASLIAASDDLEVVAQRELDGRELYDVRGTVRATELSRADLIEAALDASSFLPIIVKRSITRGNAGVLGPRAALDDQALDTAFGSEERIQTELIQLENVVYDEIVLPGELALDVPGDAEEQVRDSRFERISRAELSSDLAFRPLLPRSLPRGYEEQLMAVYRGAPQNWGPRNRLPKPKHVFHSEYFDGKTTIVLTQRHMDKQFELTGSPLARTGLPITTRRVDRDGGDFGYGVSPEVPPHVWGFIGNVFVVASGYAPQAELLRFVTSLEETPDEVPSVTSPSPGATPSPGTSPAGTAATPSPTGTTGTASPIATATP